MLRIYPIALEWLKAVRPLIAQIARYDGDLAKQLRRSSSSVILNLGEGMYSRGGHRTNAYGVALREMGESYSALQAAQVHGYVTALEPGFEALAFVAGGGCSFWTIYNVEPAFHSRSSRKRDPPAPRETVAAGTCAPSPWNR